MTRDELAALLHATGDGVEVPPAPVERMVAAGRRRAGRRRAVQVLSTVAAVVAVAALAVLVPPRLAARPAEPAVSSCVGAVVPAVLPEWARTGFSQPEPVKRFVLGDAGGIVAILFTERLAAPPAPDVNNKILWVARDPHPSGPLTITARLVGAAGEPVVQQVGGGPGPSIVDLPAPGCWHLDLTWPGHTDSLDLRYEPG